MKPPRFWQNPPQHPGWQARVLWPLSALWTSQTRKRLRSTTPAHVDVPVICIGNVTVGGTGKTPAAIRIFEHLSQQGWTPHFLTRGYGGAAQDTPLQVAPDMQADQVGDEPLLLAAFGPTWVCPDRAKSAQAAIAAGADILLMDDGFQNPGLHKDINLLVVDNITGFGNERVLPAGPLREPVSDALTRADVILHVGTGDWGGICARHPQLQTLPQMHGLITPLETGMDWDGLRVIAFAGIGRPEKFFTTLKSLGCELIAAHGFGDHATLPRKILARLAAEAKAKSAQLVTTEKDAVRLPLDWRQNVLTLPVRMQIDGLGALDLCLEQKNRTPPHQGA